MGTQPLFMDFSNTTTKDGIIQQIEFWIGKGDASISGDSTLLKIITARVNEAFSRLMPLVLSYCDKPRWDDTNHTDHPIATFDLVSGQNDYSLTTDDNGLNVLNVTHVEILQSATATQYITLQRMTVDHENALAAMAPNSSDTGVPTHFLEKGKYIFLFPEPNYNATNGVRVFFERDPSYFASTNTTKEPGIPRPFHGLLPLYAAHDWLLVNEPSNQVLITRLEAQIARREKELKDLISTRAPAKPKMTMKIEPYL